MDLVVMLLVMVDLVVMRFGLHGGGQPQCKCGSDERCKQLVHDEQCGFAISTVRERLFRRSLRMPRQRLNFVSLPPGMGV